MIRKLMMITAIAVLAAGPALAQSPAPADDDPYLWLDQIHGERALDWVKQQNAISDEAITHDPFYAQTRNTLLDMLNAPGRIATPDIRGDWVYNFWQDQTHVRGLWRRASITSYNSGQPQWETLLDIDALGQQTGKAWVWKGADCTKAFSRCLIALSPDGGDAVEVFEFDPTAKAFHKGGFSLPLAKSSAQYVNDDTILFATDFGPGSMTPSSYPRIVKLWHRGEPLAAAKTVFEGRPSDMVVSPRVFQGPYGTIALIERNPSFFTADYYAVAADGHLERIAVPEDAELRGASAGQLIFTLRNAWKTGGKTIGQGALIAIPAPGYAHGNAAPQVLWQPGHHETLGAVDAGADAVVAAVYKDVTGQARAFRFAHGRWTAAAALDLPKGGAVDIASVNDFGPQAYLRFESFTQPPTLYFDDGSHHLRPVYALPARFDPAKLDVAQHWAISKDGTRVPYFLIRPAGAKGPLPTILNGYGGFETSMFPKYWDDGHNLLGAAEAWVLKGGAIAIANIRGGGEFGPAWHRAALTTHRQRAYDDFAAVAADIEHHDWSTPKQLGIVGASNGGLLVSTVMVERPDLFGAVVCQRPLIDMIRYTRYGAGASWVAEYGDPADPAMRKYILTYSPYQNVKADVGYPPVLFITETSDDRVTPIFARMMAAKMLAQGHAVLFNEAAEGGHGPGSTHAQEADYWALSYTFFQQKLGLR